MKWEAYKKYIIGGAVCGIIVIVIIVLAVSNKQNNVNKTESTMKQVQTQIIKINQQTQSMMNQ